MTGTRNKKTNAHDVLGLIAGEGRLPFLIAAGAKKAGLNVVCVGLTDAVDSNLARNVDVFYEVAIARPGTWIRKLRKHGVTRTIMVGRVSKGRLFTPRRILHYLPDWRAFRIYYWRLRRKSKLNDSILNAVADELASGKIILEDSTVYCREHLATSGVMTAAKLRPSVQNDIDFGWEIVKKLGELDIGQAVAVKEREIIAVEAIEGTAAMIERAGKYCKSGGWTLIKASKPQQDMRFDVPCVGPDTIRALAENGAGCLVVESGKTIIIDKPDTIKLANEFNISVVGHNC
ncbi:MAG: UDP-2,3-diacylglucosamine diphosphatase LpxI [Sedimentisphaerales bacterium]|nr:UDP-2,3-diacylglucosamine diphosphatase LpxI [Sedimentisphaerales bacterium]